MSQLLFVCCLSMLRDIVRHRENQVDGSDVGLSNFYRGNTRNYSKPLLVTYIVILVSYEIKETSSLLTGELPFPPSVSAYLYTTTKIMN